MIVYPESNYDSFLSVSEANSYFETRLHSEEFLDSDNIEAALVTSFYSICELDITIDLTDATQLSDIQRAQCEQALHEFQSGTENQFSFLSISGIQFSKTDKEELPRYSERAVAILKPYLTGGTITRVR